MGNPRFQCRRSCGGFLSIRFVFVLTIDYGRMILLETANPAEDYGKHPSKFNNFYYFLLRALIYSCPYDALNLLQMGFQPEEALRAAGV